MVQPYTSATQNNNKCPHGFPVGCCPICSGMGGASHMKERQKPRVAGEMSYAQCLARWNRMQAQKDQQIQDKIDKLNTSREELKQNRLLNGLDKINQVFDKVNQNINQLISNIDKLPKVFSITINAVLNVIVRPVINFAQTVMNFVLKTLNTINDKMMQMASVLIGEMQSFIEGFKQLKITKSIKILLSLFNEKEEDDENDEKEKIKEKELAFKKIKEIIKGVFRTKNKPKEDSKENDNGFSRV